MAVEMSDADFAEIHACLFKLTHPFTDEDISDIIRRQRVCWKIVDKIASDVGLSDSGGPLLPRLP